MSTSPVSLGARFSLDRTRSIRGSTSDDPLANALRPPPGETPEARSKRIAEEEAALRRSRAIDEQLASEKRAFETKNKAVKVLLLGQSESGKSTTLKNFQLTFAPMQFQAERNAWRTVVQLNLIASVRIIVDALYAELAEITSPFPLPATSSPHMRVSSRSSTRAPSPSAPSAPSASASTSSSTPTATNQPKAPFTSVNSASSSLARARSTRPPPGTSHNVKTEPPKAKEGEIQGRPLPLTAEHRKLMLRLGALLQVERPLACAVNPYASLCVAEVYQAHTSESDAYATAHASGASRELFVLAGDDWKHSASSSDSTLKNDGTAPSLVSTSSAESVASSRKREPSYVGIHRPRIANKIFDALRPGDGSSSETWDHDRQRKGKEKERGRERAEEWEREHGQEGATSVLAACREDVVALWSDPVVRAVLKRRQVDIESYPGFFLDDADRIAQMEYEPSDGDILKARLQTLGVEEHHLKMEMRTSITDPRRDWIIYDVGGHRSNRHKWIPYFENVDAIIFLAPLVFTQTLVEDPTVSRIEDSLALWKKICAHPLLARATLVLFLNKVDLVARVLEQGIRLRDYVPSFGNQSNDLRTVIKYFRTRFKTYQKSLSPSPRIFYCHETTVIDAQATSAILRAVREGIIYQNLQDAKVI